MRKIMSGLVGVLLLCSTGAFAHAHLQSSQPAKGAKVAPTTQAVTLDFDEEVTAEASTFKVYPVTDEAAASKLMTTALTPKAAVAGNVASGVVPSKGAVKSVNIKLTTPLKPGTYAVLWKVLASDDGHVTSGHFLFTIAGK